MAMGILSPSKLFTKHGDKMIFKIIMLSPLQKHDNGDLVSIKIFIKDGGSSLTQTETRNYNGSGLELIIFTTNFRTVKMTYF